MKALTETKPSERISLASHISQQRTVTRAARFRQKMRRWWPFYVMALPGVIYFFYLALFTHLGNENRF